MIILCYILSYEDFLEIEMYFCKVGVYLYIIDDFVIYIVNCNIGKYMIYEVFLVNMFLKYCMVDEMILEMNIIKMMMIDELEVLDFVIVKLLLYFIEKYMIVKSIFFYYEIMNKNVSKGNVLVKLVDYLGLNKDEVMVIGDNENDLFMIDYVGIGVVMGNVIENVKIIVDVYIISNDEDGVV